jgi:hypothetical protein
MIRLDTAARQARDPGPRGITANVLEAGLMESGMEPPDPETLKALVSSLSLQRAAATTSEPEPCRAPRRT